MIPTEDLEARVMNRLQLIKSGQTIEQLETYLGERQSKILQVLYMYKREGYVTVSKYGVWTLVRQ
jgi:hypothetical protein